MSYGNRGENSTRADSNRHTLWRLRDQGCVVVPSHVDPENLLMEWILILIVSGVIASYAYGVGNRFGRKLGGYMIREHRRYRLPRE